MRDLDVAPLALGADQVGFADFAFLQDRPHRARVVVDVYPSHERCARRRKAGACACEDVGDLPGDELLRMLIGP